MLLEKTCSAHEEIMANTEEIANRVKTIQELNINIGRNIPGKSNVF